MEKIEVEVFSQAINQPVIRMPGRKYPGVLIQGDSLTILYGWQKKLLNYVKFMDYRKLERMRRMGL